MSYIGNLDTHRGLIGKIGEDLACEYLIAKGHVILHRNWRIKYGEIDIVSEHKGKLHFVEVKTVKSLLTTPQEHLDRRKLQKLKKLAELFYNQMVKNEDTIFSLDFIGITLNSDNSKKSLDYLESIEI
jgi:putative endonuclease